MSTHALRKLEDGPVEEPLMAPSATRRVEASSRLHALLDLLRPEIASGASRATPSGGRGGRAATAHLDGLRGWAAMLVYVSHHLLGAHMSHPLEMGFGYGGRRYLVAVPLLRTLFTGSHMAVHVFFVLSGVVLSRSVLLLAREGASGDRIAAALASAASRRYVRLWAPVVGTTFCVMLLGFALGDPFSGHPLKSNVVLQTGNWLFELGVLMTPTSSINWLSYNAHTWTIPWEFRGSMYVFLSLMATHRMRSGLRMALLSGIAVWLHIYGAWGVSTFLSGIVLTEIALLEDHEWPTSSWLLFLQRHKTRILSALLVFALHLGGQPALPFGPIKPVDYVSTPGFYYLGYAIPNDYFGHMQDFWYSVGAVIVVVAVSYLPSLRRLFEMRFTQYLGRHSYGLYLVHGPVMFHLGDRLYAAVGLRTQESPHLNAWNNIWSFGHVGPVGLELNFLCCQLVLLPLTFYLGEICTKVFDEPSIRLARHLYQKALA